tara:strand:- start:8737 stop:9828 length:1092 start_codon:yes stop_codon:yes gene_type:complete
MSNQKFRILVIGDKNRFIHLEKFLSELQKKNIETILINDLDYVDKFFELNFIKKNRKKNNFNSLLQDFKPNVILVDRISKIIENIIEKEIPFWILLRGNYWEESSWAKKTIYKSRKQKISSLRNDKLIDYCFKHSDLILPISKYLEKEVKMRYPNKPIHLFPADGRNPDEWNKIDVKKLKHPCVGLIQGLNIWGKTKELLLLKEVMKKLPDITFYLAGDGIYRERIIPELSQNKNFVWLKNLEYPHEVKKLFSEIDIFLLLSGLEGLGQIIIESFLMKKPTIASNTGGIPELIQDNQTGLLVDTGNSEMIVDRIHKLLDDPVFAQKLALNGNNFAKKEFSWENIADRFIQIIISTKIGAEINE